MPRKIDIELTSARADGTWTWRVAGARQPKGTLDGSLLPSGASVGDVLRAEAEIELEGTVIMAVATPPGKRPDPDRLELLGDTRPFEGVTTSLVPKGSGRPRRDRDDPGRTRSDRGDQTRGRPGRDGTGPRGERGPARSGRPPDTGGPAGAGAEHGRGTRSPRPRRPEEAGREGGDEARRDERPGSGARPADRRPDGRRPPSSRPDGEVRRDREGSRRREGDAGAGRERTGGPPRPKRLSPGSAHRRAVLEALAPEERAVAEQLLQGGIPAVRRALQEQNAHAREEGRPEVKAEPLLALAEELLPRLKAAEWRDRADAAAKDVDEIGLRDLRSVVAGADAGARDDEGRILAKTLREALDRREAAARDSWLAEVTTCLDEGRVTRALRLAGRPPDPRSRVPAELAARLAESASAAMAPDTPPDRWAALLSAVLESPVRRSVKPVGLPAVPGDALLAAARQTTGRIPALAAMLGLQMPPPPGPPRQAVRPQRPPNRSPAKPEPAPPTASAPPLEVVEPAPADEPRVVEEPPPAGEAPTPTAEESGAEDASRASAPTPTAVEEPAAVVGEPAARVQPAVEEPAAAQQPAGVNEQTVVDPPPGDAPTVEEPAVEQPPAAADGPSAVDAPPAEERPAAADGPSAGDAPPAEERPAAADGPSAADAAPGGSAAPATGGTKGGAIAPALETASSTPPRDVP